MDQRPPAREFGKRQPPKTPPVPPAKRSGHVVLLLMGTLAVGGGAYALMPRPNCAPNSPGMAEPALPDERCHPNGASSGGGGGGGGHGASSQVSSSGDASGRSASAGASESGSGGVTRGGFGSFGHGFGGSGGE
jgi:hypothetical protein